MNILALDFGTKRIGVAVGDTEVGIAFPREEIKNTFLPDKEPCLPKARACLDSSGDILDSSEGLRRVLRKKENPVFFHILTLCRQEDIEKIIVGLPLMPAGHDSKETENARRFAEDLEDFLLENNCSIPVDYMDERYSSKTAQIAAQQSGLSEKQSRGKIDSAAAAIFLQQYLDRG